ncbi:Smr/MutS family protein [Oscillospiraceae bacterium OttesenSCG-928-G22]|nr:Smr/MutS family protein [Oscillospiraceae bacterium OttesenSCG-928-G22]
MGGQIKTVNLEEGMPTAERAIKRLTFELRSSGGKGVSGLKLIHGYGSSGTGGVLRREVRKYLENEKRRGRIRSFVTGEAFSIFDEETRTLLGCCPDFRNDRDLERHNNGVTFVLL